MSKLAFKFLPTLLIFPCITFLEIKFLGERKWACCSCSLCPVNCFPESCALHPPPGRDTIHDAARLLQLNIIVKKSNSKANNIFYCFNLPLITRLNILFYIYWSFGFTFSVTISLWLLSSVLLEVNFGGVCWFLRRLCGSVRGGFGKGNGLCAPWCQTLRFLPVCPWWLWSCCDSAWAQREWVRVSPCVGSLRDTAWDSRSFFHRLYFHWFLRQEVVGSYLPGAGTLSWEYDVGLRLLTPEISLSSFYPSHVGKGPACSTSASLLPVWMDVASLIS